MKIFNFQNQEIFNSPLPLRTVLWKMGYEFPDKGVFRVFIRKGNKYRMMIEKLDCFKNKYQWWTKMCATMWTSVLSDSERLAQSKTHNYAAMELHKLKRCEPYVSSLDLSSRNS